MNQKAVVDVSARAGRKASRLRRPLPALAVTTHPNPDLKAHYFAEILRGVRAVLGDDCALAVNPGDCKGMAGLLALAPAPGDPALEAAARAGLPVAVVNADAARFPSVDLDNVGAAFEAVSHLIGLGHRHIAMINGPAAASNARDRLEGWRRALQAARIPAREELLATGHFTRAGGREAMSGLLRLKKPPTAVFAANDQMASGAWEAALGAGMQVPGDMAVVGFDDDGPSAALGLTTVRQPLTRMGRQAALLLLERMDPSLGAELRPRRVLMKGRLIVRASCGAGGLEAGLN
jgi:DNA-binding LacI/PurR family transcriptional regulator